MSNMGGGAQCVKYSLFFFNFLFLLGGLALIIVGALAQAKANSNGFGGAHVGAGGIFIIIVGVIVFLVSFFGCAGAINENQCMIVTFGVLLILLLLAEIAGIIIAFYLKDQVEHYIGSAMDEQINEYNPNNPLNTSTKNWDDLQSQLECCGSRGYWSWNASQALSRNQSVPDSCCHTRILSCGYGMLKPDADRTKIFDQGCVTAVTVVFKKALIILGAVAVAVAAVELLGIIFAFCLAHCLRKDYRVV